MSYTHHFTFRACISAKGIHSFTTDRMIEMWRRLVGEGKQRFLFYDGHISDWPDYYSFMRDPGVYAYAVYDPATDEPLATYFVNNFVGHAAMMHFAYLDAGLSRRYAIGIDVCNFLLRNGGLSALIGITPRPFRHAWKFALEVGFVQKAILPQACRIVTDGHTRMVDAVATLCTPETLKPYPTEA